jgi:uncharacterized membrane protein
MRPRRPNDRGAVLLLTALVLPVLLLATSFAVDLGRQRSARRTMQARADVIALDLARLIDGGTTANNMNYSAALTASAARNDIPVAKISSVQWGTLDQATNQFIGCATCVPTAVKVTTADTVSYFFQRGNGAVTRSAVGTSGAKAGFSIGSFAASVSTGSSPLLNALIGDALNLGVLSYSGLATSNLSFLGIANQMGLVTPTSLFTSNVSAFDALSAAAVILQQQSPNSAQVQVLNQVLAVPNSPLKNVSVADVVKVQAGGEASALASQVNLFDFLTTAAFIANGTSGLSIPSTVINVPGISSATALSLIQGPSTVFGGIGATTGLSQAGLTTTWSMGTTSLGQKVVNTLTDVIPGICGLLLLGAVLCGLTSKLVSVDVQASLSLNLASADGTIARIGCGAPQTLGIDVLSELTTVHLSFSAVVHIGTATTTVPLSVDTVAPVTNGAANFTIPPDVYGVFKPSVPSSGALGLEGLTINGLGGLGAVVTPVLQPILNTTIKAVSDNLVEPLSAALGARVAGADVAPLQITCNSVQLVG